MIISTLVNMTTPSQVQGTVVCSSSIPIIVFFSCGSRATIEQVEIISTIFVKNIEKIFWCLAFILDSRCEYDLRTRALLSRHICIVDVTLPIRHHEEVKGWILSDKKTQRMKSSILTLLSSQNNINH